MKWRIFYMKTTLEEKLRLVKLHIDENVPIFEIERKYRLDHSTLKYYCALYRRLINDVVSYPLQTTKKDVSYLLVKDI